MRVIIITSSTNRSGGTRQAIYQARGLTDRGHQVTLCLPAQSSFWELPPEQREDHWFALPENRKDWRAAVESLLPADRTVPTVVHAFHNKAVKRVAWWSLFWMKRGVVCVAHRGVIFRPGNPLPYLSPGMKAFITNSRACARALRLHCPARKLHVVPNGVPDSRITPQQTPEAVRASLHLAEPFLFGCVGNNSPVKGTERLLRAFAVARGNNLRAELLLVGPTPERWLPLCRELDVEPHVRFTGKVENVADYLQICHCFVFPSVGMDSAPNTLLEAMRLGLPVVANAVGGVPDMAEGCGLLLPPGNDATFADALISMAGNTTQREGFAAQSRERGQTFTVEARCIALEKIYGELLDKSRT